MIENYAALKQQLQADGVEFRSDTDTEVLAHLIAHFYHGDLLAAVAAGAGAGEGHLRPRGRCASTSPGVIVGARLGSPLVIGIGDDGHYLASDAERPGRATPTRSSTSTTGRSCQLDEDELA